MDKSLEELKKILPEDGPNLQEVSKYIEKYKDELIVIKYGGNVFIDRQIFNNFINDLDSNSSKIVSDILINEDKYQLHDWERKNIYVKKIGSELSQLVNETILNMRRYLIDKKINELQESNKDEDKGDVLEEVMSYYKLKKMLSARLNRVV